MTRNISRKTFLQGAIGIVAGGALSGSVRASAIPNAQGLSDPNIPPGVKLRGANLVGNYTQTTDADGNDIWASLWGVWELGRPYCAAIGRHRQNRQRGPHHRQHAGHGVGTHHPHPVPCPMETIPRPRPIARTLGLPVWRGLGALG